MSGDAPLHHHLGRLPRWGRPPRLPRTTSRASSIPSSTTGPATYRVPFDDLMGEDASRNWDHHRRLAELEADGIVAEVVFPNTIPPFYPEPSLKAQVPGATEGDLELRWAGLRAHNRWLADFCAAAPGRRLGIVQIMLHDVPAAVAEVEWAAEAGHDRRGPPARAPPGSGLEPLYSRVYDPLWRACEVAGLPVNHHSGSAVPALGDADIDKVMFMLEVTWWAHRSLWHLIFAGVLERHPGPPVRLHRAGNRLDPRDARNARLLLLDGWARRPGSQELEWGGAGRLTAVAAAERVLGPPVPRRVQLHAPGRSGHATRRRRRQDHVGKRLPPQGVELSVQHGGAPALLRRHRSRRGPADARAATPPDLFGFDLDGLSDVAARVGPTHDEIGPTTASDGDPERRRALPGLRRRHLTIARSNRQQPTTTRSLMGTVRYGARSEEQLRNREVEATSVDVWATTLVATYLTDPEVIAAVLPPPIEPGDEPLVKVTVATVDIPGYPTFGAGSFSVRARHEGTDGYYALLMPMTTEQSVIGGRETFGEPKKLGRGRPRPPGRPGDRHLRPDGHRDRQGRGPGRPVSSSCPTPRPGPTSTSSSSRPPTARDSTAIRPSSTATGPSRPASSKRSPARSSCASRDSTRSPTSRCGNCVSITLAERSSIQRGEIHGTVPGEWIRPYVHQRYDDLSPVGSDDRGACRARVAVVTGGAGGHRPGHGRALRPRGHERGPRRRRTTIRSPTTVAKLRAEGLEVIGAQLRRVGLRLGRTAARRDARGTSVPSISCATTPASVPGPRVRCGSTSSTTGAGRSTSTCTGSSTGSTPSSRPCSHPEPRDTWSTPPRATEGSRPCAARLSTR